MSAAYKPQGYSSVSPYLVVEGAERTIRFLVEALDAVELRRFLDPAGRVIHAEVRIDDSVVMIADGNEGWPPQGSHVHVYVPEVDQSFRRALEAGGTPVQEPSKQEGDDDRRGGVRDPGGATWWISTKVA